MRISESMPGTVKPPAIDVFIGTKAQYIKTAPLLRLLTADGIAYRLIDSGQHARTAADLRRFLGVHEPDAMLQDRGNIKTVFEALRWLLANLLLTVFRPSVLRRRFFSNGPGFCIIHGDTPSTLLGLIMAKRAGKRIVHIEAGLRSHNLLRPFPEELIRIICMKLSDVLFAPSDWAEVNLRKMKVRGQIFNTRQNTNIEALAYAMEKGQPQLRREGRPYCVVTMHRVETIMSEKRLRFVIKVIERLANDRTVVFVRHDPTEKKLADFGLQLELDSLKNIVQQRLMPHHEFVHLIADAEFVMTDGGSIQEESFYLGRPCLVMRSETERQEGIGDNVVMGQFDWPTIEAFLDSYKSRERETRIETHAPSVMILDALKSLKTAI